MTHIISSFLYVHFYKKQLYYLYVKENDACNRKGEKVMKEQTLLREQTIRNISLNKDWNELNDLHECWLNMSCKPDFKKLNVNYIEDENKSVKWNREFVEKQNLKYEEEVKELNRKKNAARENVIKQLNNLVSKELEYKFSELDVARMCNSWMESFSDLGFYKMCIKILIECDTTRKMDYYRKMRTKKGVE